jgi:hypothetical protein
VQPRNGRKSTKTNQQGGARCHTNTRRAKALVATRRHQDLHAASLLVSLFCLKAFSLLYMVALALVCIFGGTWTLLYVWVYGCMDVWCYSHSFCVFGAFSHTMLALASLLLSCHTSVCLDALLNTTHTPHNAGPRAMSRNTKQAMLGRVGSQKERGVASYT